ncbi:MAG: hypothetical protein HY593_02865 [Candidatus Omnitrophica bacterium]|nr:hypothetical protein [Candidatus Omnitrophota bacterium]
MKNGYLKRSVSREFSLFGGRSERVGACHGIPLSVAGTARNQCRAQCLDAPCERNAVAAPPQRKRISFVTERLAWTKNEGFGLIIFLVLMVIFMILVTASSLYFMEAVRQVQLRIDQTKAHYLAQAGVKRAIYDWIVSGSNENNRRYAELNTTVTGNQLFKTGAQANFAFFRMDTGPANWTTAKVGGVDRRRFRNWTINNIHVNVPGSTADDITAAQVRVSWSPVGTTALRQVVLNNNAVTATGSYASGATVALSGSTADLTLSPGGSWSGITTYLEWVDANVPDPVQVNVQWTFTDDSGTKDSKSHDVLYWNGAQAGSAPGQHTFAITSTGQVDQTAGARGIQVLKTVKAVVSTAPGGDNVEIIDWEEIDQNIP